MPSLIFALGLAIGSFLNVCIYRIPREGLRIYRPRRSFCPACQTNIRPYDNIPLLSYLILKGRCRDCGTRIPVDAPLSELLTGLLFLILYYRFGLTLGLLHGCLFISLLIPIAFIDAEWYRIPNAIILTGLISGFAVVISTALIQRNAGYLTEHLLGALAGGLTMAFIALLGYAVFRKPAMGTGDIKLMSLIGLFLGGWPHLLIVLVFSAFTGCIAGVFLLFHPKRPLPPIPYGPFLAIAALLDLLWSNALWGWYIKFLN